MREFLIVLVAAIPVLALLLAVRLVVARPKLERRLAAYRPSPSKGPRERRLAQLSFSRRVVLPLLSNLAAVVARMMPGGARSRLQARLDTAGRPGGLTPGTLWTLSFVLGLLFAVVPAAAVAVTSVAPTPMLLGAIVALAVLGSRLPGFWLSRQSARRNRVIQRELPDALDLIVVSVEAGLGLDAALARVAQRSGGALAQELARTLEDIRLGRARKHALMDAADRVAVPEFRQFVAAVVQTMDIGGDLGQVLRIQAEAARTRRRQRAQERALKAPVKMVFPLVLLVFPSLFIVLLAPAALRAFELFR